MSAASSEIFIEGVAQNSSETAPDIILIKLFQIHDRCVILAVEPLAALSHFRSASCLSVKSSHFWKYEVNCCFVLLHKKAVIVPQKYGNRSYA